MDSMEGPHETEDEEIDEDDLTVSWASPNFSLRETYRLGKHSIRRPESQMQDSGGHLICGPSSVGRITIFD